MQNDQSKLTKDQIREIFEHRAEGLSFRQIAPLYGVSYQTISNVIKGDRHGGEIDVPGEVMLKVARMSRQAQRVNRWQQIMKAKNYSDKGNTYDEIAMLMGVHATTVGMWMKDYRTVMELIEDKRRK